MTPTDGSRSTLVDTNVLPDVTTADPVWGSWSRQVLSDALDHGEAVLSPVVYAELSARWDKIGELDAILPNDVFRREWIPWEAAFLAGRAHLAYRRRRGTRERTLPDFFVGAHAAIRGYRLLTRDAGRYRTAYPGLHIISP